MFTNYTYIIISFRLLLENLPIVKYRRLSSIGMRSRLTNITGLLLPQMKMLLLLLYLLIYCH